MKGKKKMRFVWDKKGKIYFFPVQKVSEAWAFAARKIERASSVDIMQYYCCKKKADAQEFYTQKRINSAKVFTIRLPYTTRTVRVKK